MQIKCIEYTINFYYFYHHILATGRELNSLVLPDHNGFTNFYGIPFDGSKISTYTQNYQYDELGNILQMKSVGQWTRDYYYDTSTNRLTTHTQGGPDVYTYDQHGNTTKMPHLQEIKWDWKDQMKEATLNASNDKAYYVYDSGGERVRKVIEKTNITEERYYLGGYEIYRRTNSGTLEVERESLFIEDGSKAIAQIDNDSTTETIRYQYDNHLGSASLELDETGDIISYEEYHPFGTTSYRSGRDITEVSLKRYKYVGKERDNETGLYYYGARYFADWIARWISPDPAGTVDAPSLYVYVKNNPVKLTDPSGMQTENDVNQTDPPKKEPKETFEIPEYKNESMAVDKTNMVNQDARLENLNLNNKKAEKKELSPEVKEIQKKIEGFVRNADFALDAVYSVSYEMNKRYIISSAGDFYLKKSDTRLDFSKNQILEAGDAPLDKISQRYTGMTDDLAKSNKMLKNAGRIADLGFIVYDASLFFFSKDQQTKDDAGHNLGIDALSTSFGYFHPALGITIIFADIVMSSNQFKQQMLNEYENKMNEYKNTDYQKYINAKELYQKYYKELYGEQEYKVQPVQLYFNPKN